MNNTEPIPEARHAMMDLASYMSDGRAMSDQAETIITQACLAYHKRKLEECGGDLSVVEKTITEYGNLQFDCGEHGDADSEEYRAILQQSHNVRKILTELLQLHTTKAVEEATANLRTALEFDHRAFEDKEKQCEELRGCKEHHDYCRSLLNCPADDVLAESILGLENKCGELRRACELLKVQHGLVEKERDDLRTENDALKNEFGSGICSAHMVPDPLNCDICRGPQGHSFWEKIGKEMDELKSRAEKGEALAADRELSLKQRDEAQDLRDKYGMKLAQLQQDVRPLVQSLRNIAAAGNAGMPELPRREDGAVRTTKVHATEALETFLAKHPELK